jgi:hypothetical protein
MINICYLLGIGKVLLTCHIAVYYSVKVIGGEINEPVPFEGKTHLGAIMGIYIAIISSRSISFFYEKLSVRQRNNLGNCFTIPSVIVSAICRAPASILPYTAILDF